MGESDRDETKGDVRRGGALNLASEREKGGFFSSWVEVQSENVAVFHRLWGDCTDRRQEAACQLRLRPPLQTWVWILMLSSWSCKPDRPTPRWGKAEPKTPKLATFSFNVWDKCVNSQHQGVWGFTILMKSCHTASQSNWWFNRSAKNNHFSSQKEKIPRAREGVCPSVQRFAPEQLMVCWYSRSPEEESLLLLLVAHPLGQHLHF